MQKIDSISDINTFIWKDQGLLGHGTFGCVVKVPIQSEFAERYPTPYIAVKLVIGTDDMESEFIITKAISDKGSQYQIPFCERTFSIYRICLSDIEDEDLEFIPKQCKFFFEHLEKARENIRDGSYSLLIVDSEEIKDEKVNFDFQ